MKQRLDYISILRVGAMLAVVVYHCLCGYSTIWGGTWSWQVIDVWNTIAHVLSYYHMPLFVLISGFLFKYVQSTGKYSTFKPFLRKKIKRIVIPYIFWGSVLYVILGGRVGRLQDGYMHLWFLFFIFQAYLTYFFINKVINNGVAEISIVITSLLAIVLFEKFKSNIGLWEWGIHSYLHYMPYYIIGVLVCRFLQRYSLAMNMSVVGLVTCLLGFIFCYWFVCKYTLAVLFALFVLVFGICAMSKLSIKANVWIKKLDNYCLPIYILHHPIIQLMNDSEFGITYMPHYWIYPIAQFCVVMLLSLFITMLFVRCRLGKVVLGL